MQHPVYGWPAPPAPSTRRGRVKHQLVIGLALFTVALLGGVLRHPRGLLAVGLAWALIGLLSAYPARERVRVVLVGGVAAALVWALLSTAPASPPPTKRRQPPPRAQTTEVNLEDARGFVADRYACFASGFSRFQSKCLVEGAPPVKGGR